jgi:hypothetical protein
MRAAREEKSRRRLLVGRAWRALAPPLGLRAQFCEGEQCRRFTVAHNRLRRDGIFLADPSEGSDRWLCSPQCFEQALLALIHEIGLRERSRRVAARALPRMPHHLALLNKGLILEADLQKAQQYVEQSGLRLGEALLSLSLVSEEQLAEAYARENGCAFYKLAPAPILSAAVLPGALSLHFAAVTVHAQAERTLIGFTKRIDRGLLALAGQMSGCRTEACFITERHLQTQLSVDGNVAVTCTTGADFETASPSVAAHVIARHAEQLGSERVRLAGSSGMLWARLCNDGGHTRPKSGTWHDEVFVIADETSRAPRKN